MSPIALAAIIGGPVITLVAVLLLYERLEPTVGRILALLGRFFSWAKKRATAVQIQGQVNLRTRELSAQIGNYELPRLKLVFVKGEEVSELRDGEVIVRMKQGDTSTSNYLAAADEFVSRGVLPKAKRYLSTAQRNAIDTFIMQKIVAGDPGIETGFYDEVFVERLSTEQSRKFYDAINKCDSIRLFFPLIVRELQYLGNKVFFGKHDDVIVKDVSALLLFVCEFADREIGAEMDMACKGSLVRCGIVIIARRVKREVGKIEPYVRFIGDLCDQGIEGIYIVGSSVSANKTFMQDISREACRSHCLTKVCEHTYKSYVIRDGKRVPVVNTLIVLRNPDATHFISADTVGELLTQPFEKLEIDHPYASE